jgi:hypothetical protein
MFSFFRSKKTTSPAVAAPAPANPKRMTLEERKSFRQEMIYQSVRESFLSMEVVSSMYKFKVMPVDERHHRFIIMIDVAKSFVTGRDSKTKSFAALEKSMRSNAYKRFGILIEGTYWRVSESEDQFERFSRNSDATGTPLVAKSASPANPKDTHKDLITPMARLAYQTVSEDESEAFMAALRSGLALPAVQVGDQEYQSDLAPLDGGIMIGGTQYGKL